MTAEIEYKFQHEETSESRDEAHAAVNRTLWLDHWHRVRKVVNYEIFAITTFSLIAIACYTFGPTILRLIPALSLSSLPYYTLLYGALAAAVLLTVARYRTKATRPVNPDFGKVIKRPKIIEALSEVFYYTAFVASNVFEHHGHLVVYLYFASFLIMFSWDWVQMRKLRKNMIKWGLIKSGKQTIDQSPHLAVQLREAEKAVDETIGPPKKRLLKRAIPQ